MRPSYPKTARRLVTPYQAGEIPFSEYPRPQLKRDSYCCLNGRWTLSCRRGRTVTPVGEILAPFPPESDASGIGQTPDRCDEWIYERCFSLPEGFRHDRVLLHFGAVDRTARVFVNGHAVGEHDGGYDAFTLDITAVLTKGENALRVEVSDPLDTDYPYGKQRKKRGGMWYTPVSGIWQTVWLESVPAHYLRAVRFTPTLSGVTVETEGGAEEKHLRLHTDSGVRDYCFCGDSFTLSIDDPQLWTPETPYLYDVTITSGEDEVRSYFALRTVTAGVADGKPRLLLNGKPYAFHGILDQGYFADGIFLPSSEEGYRDDVRLVKSLGFNMIRKHIKTEPEVFYYECDRQGVAVFQDMINNGRYSFLRDTALPTVGSRRFSLPRLTTKRRRCLFRRAAEATVRQLYNHPCVVYYTLFNEGWGQHDPNRLYAAMKALDGSRVWDTTSGWFTSRASDVQSEHVYFKPIALTAGNKPLVLSEFGGYSLPVEGHSFHPQRVYGYRRFDEPSLWNDALYTLYHNEVVPAFQNGLSAAILTQLSDVEDEVNGLVTYDRQVVKADADVMRRIAAEIAAVSALK